MTDADIWSGVARRLKSVPAQWASYSVFASFMTYALGYLVTRFYLTAYGLSTDLSVLDERYVFSGAKFLVYVVSTLTTVLFFAMLVGGPAYLIWKGISRMLGRRGSAGDARAPRLGTNALAVAGIVLSVLVVQLFMRKVFFFDELLLQPHFPREKARWLADLMLAQDANIFDYYFLGLLLSVVATTGLLLSCLARQEAAPANRGLLAAFIFAWSTQCLFLPVNYGYLLASKNLPRVASLDGVKPLLPNEEAWLVWEGQVGLTYLVRQTDGANAKRFLVTVPRADVKQVKVIGSDRILRTLFVVP